MHTEDTQRVFVLSFCNSEAQNIPLFYLYAGIDGKGCRLQFTDAKIREMLRECTVSYVNSYRKRLKGIVPASDYEIFYDWIHYISKNGHCSYRGKETDDYESIEAACQQLKKDNLHYFVKSPIWKFENEFRIVIVFKKDISYDRVALNFRIKDKERGITAIFGPETKDEEFASLKEEFLGYGKLKTDRVSRCSISMGLVEKNKSLMKKKEV